MTPEETESVKAFLDSLFIGNLDNDLIADRIRKLETENARLREALEPFAKIGEVLSRFPEFQKHPTNWLWGTDECAILAADCFRAEKALEKTK